MDMNRFKNLYCLFITMMVVFMTTSCHKEEIDVLFFIYENATSHQLKIETYGEQGLVDVVNIAPFSKYSIDPYIFPSGEPLEYPFIFRTSTLYAQIVFDNKKIIVYQRDKYSCETQPSPWCYFSNTFYKLTASNLVRRKELHSEYTYTFTEEDYRNATPLVFGEGFVGSVWRCTVGAGLQEGLLYNELRFVSESEVEGWVLLEGESEPEWFFNATYSIEGETLTISDGGDSFTAVLNEDYSGLVTNIDGEGECIFVMQ